MEDPYTKSQLWRNSRIERWELSACLIFDLLYEAAAEVTVFELMCESDFNHG